jgi:hypothetical protein
MNRSDVTELHYITAMANLSSIMSRGILCNVKARRYGPTSIADPAIQERRANRDIPGGLKLSEYANLYFNARNAMLYRITHHPIEAPATDLAILRVDRAVLNLSGVVITEANAAAGLYPRWHPIETGLGVLDKEELFAERWTDSERHKQRMMAEVLVPWQVPVGYVTGMYVVSEEAATNLPRAARRLAVKVSPYMFFRSPRT